MANARNRGAVAPQLTAAAPNEKTGRDRNRDEDEERDSSFSSSSTSSSSSSSSSSFSSSSSSDGKKKNKRTKERLAKRLKKGTREIALDNRSSSVQDSRAIGKVLAPKWGKLKKFRRYVDQMTDIIRDRMDKLPFRIEKKAEVELRDFMMYVMKSQELRFKSTAKAA